VASSEFHQFVEFMKIDLAAAGFSKRALSTAGKTRLAIKRVLASAFEL
jgi:hypothetical protein